MRCDPGEDLADQVARALELGASWVEHDWGELPWVVLADPSGNEFCILPPGTSAGGTSRESALR
ncbi:MAG: VOC family protein [Ornithinimicrobium sp.]|uniref:VOC family protein n=1 Tax=Ornithinimicrobium sp. TaxID=1977084 RepID=UPI003D9ABE0E